MSDTSTSTRTQTEAAFDRVTSTVFAFFVLAATGAVLLIGPMEALERFAVLSRRVLHLLGL